MRVRVAEGFCRHREAVAGGEVTQGYEEVGAAPVCSVLQRGEKRVCSMMAPAGAAADPMNRISDHAGTTRSVLVVEGRPAAPPALLWRIEGLRILVQHKAGLRKQLADFITRLPKAKVGVPPAQLPFMRMSATGRAPVLGSGLFVLLVVFIGAVAATPAAAAAAGGAVS